MEQLDYDYLAKLVKKTQDGDSNAFAELYAATYQKEYRFAYQYVKDPYLAQDILQDLYIIVLKNIQTLKNPRLFISWLQQICFRLCFDAAKKQQKHAEELVYEDIRKLDVLEYASSSTPPPKKSGTSCSSSGGTDNDYGEGSFSTSAICPGYYHALLQQHGFR